MSPPPLPELMESADEIASILRRTADLRAKIDYSVDAACAGLDGSEGEEEGEEEAASLLSIRDAIVSSRSSLLRCRWKKKKTKKKKKKKKKCGGI